MLLLTVPAILCLPLAVLQTLPAMLRCGRRRGEYWRAGCTRGDAAAAAQLAANERCKGRFLRRGMFVGLQCHPWHCDEGRSLQNHVSPVMDAERRFGSSLAHQGPHLLPPSLPAVGAHLSLLCSLAGNDDCNKGDRAVSGAEMAAEVAIGWLSGPARSSTAARQLLLASNAPAPATCQSLFKARKLSQSRSNVPLRALEVQATFWPFYAPPALVHRLAASTKALADLQVRVCRAQRVPLQPPLPWPLPPVRLAIADGAGPANIGHVACPPSHVQCTLSPSCGASLTASMHWPGLAALLLCLPFLAAASHAQHGSGGDVMPALAGGDMASGRRLLADPLLPLPCECNAWCSA